MKYDYFVASRWRNRDEVLKLVHALRNMGKSVYCFLDAPQSVHRIKEDPEESMKKFEARDWRKDSYIREVFEKDMEAEKSSKNFILLLPAGKSAHMEVGAAYGMNKHTILIGEQEKAESLYLIFDEVYPTIKAFTSSLES